MGDHATITLPEDSPPVEADAAAAGKDAAAEAAERVPYRDLFRYANVLDKILLVVGSLGSLVYGAAWPVWSLSFSDVIDEFGSSSDLVEDVRGAAFIFLYIGAAIGISSFLSTWALPLVGTRQLRGIRGAFLQSVMRQEMAWHDATETAELDRIFTTNISSLKMAVGQKLFIILSSLSQFVAGIVIGFYLSWKVALVIVGLFVAQTIVIIKLTKNFTTKQNYSETLYGKAGAVANEVFALIRTVIAFGTTAKESARYNASLDPIVSERKSLAIAAGFNKAAPWSLSFVIYFVAYMFGGWLIRDGEATIGDVFGSMTSLLIAGSAVGRLGEPLSVISLACKTAKSIFDIINRTPVIDSLSEEGKSADNSQGNITFRDVHFTYASRTDPALRGVTFSVQRGQTLALVGPSGSGKSSIISLLERFYDPDSGVIELDGKPLAEYNIQSLRQHIGLVNQTPTLFEGSIFDNIAIAKPGASGAEVILAAKAANAHDFIQDFPDGYDTQVGDLGGQLSGGQRQRIVIARALIKDPRILLLDEATSALDNTSEAIVQSALDSASAGRTTIVVAHRLSTVVSADKIVVIKDGTVVEEGNHDSLVARNGMYAEMIKQQGLTASEIKARRTSAAARMSVKLKGHGDDDDEAAKIAAKLHSSTESMASDASSSDGSSSVPLREMIKYARSQSIPERGLFRLAMVGAFLGALTWPAYSGVLAGLISLLQDQDHNQTTLLYWCIGVLSVAVLASSGFFTLSYFETLAGSSITDRVRRTVFARAAQQPCSFHDQNQRHVLVTMLSKDASHMKDLAVCLITNVLLSAGTIVFGIVVSLAFCWQVGMVMLAAMPIIAAGHVLRNKFEMNISEIEDSLLVDTTTLAIRGIEHTRSIAALGHIPVFLDSVTLSMKVQMRKLSRRYLVPATLLGFLGFASFGTWALAFWFGAYTVEEDNCTFENMFRSLIEILFPAILAGIYASEAPDASEAASAIRRIRKLFQTTEQTHALAAENAKKQKLDIKGRIEFRNVCMRYPARPDKLVLDNFSLVVEPGQTVALCGASGSGKSTVVLLVGGFYEIESGQILIDGVDIKDVNLDYIRSQIAVVSQEPHLFSRSIAKNITYGVEDASQAQIEEAARQANAYDFCVGFEEGFATEVGEFGSQLSGGQRQRVAIARALLRRDQIRIALLDEATSALDSESELLVQEALDRTREGRTSLVVAHRLSTIRSADKIVVMRDGRVLEQGTHQELMARRSHYFSLAHALDSASPEDTQGLISDAVDLDDLDSAVGVAEEPQAPATSYRIDEV